MAKYPDQDLSEKAEVREEVRATPLEGFMDLAFVVIIHVVFIPMEEHETIFVHNILHSALCFYSIWTVWAFTSDYLIRTRLFNGNKLRLFDCLVVSLVMTNAAFLAAASEEHNDFEFIVAHIAGLIVPMFAYMILPYRSGFPREDSKIMLIGFPMIGFFYMPLLFWQDGHLVFWTSCVLAFHGVTIAAQTFSPMSVKNDSFESNYLSLWNERNELIVLISLGEIIAAFIGNFSFHHDLSGYLTALSEFLTAFALYLLYFTVHPKSWKPWHAIAPDNSMMWIHQNSQMCIVFAYACVGCAYARLLEIPEAESSEARTLEEIHEESSAEAEIDSYAEARRLLCFGLCLVLMVNALCHLSGTYERSKLNIPFRFKYGIEFSVGIFFGILAFVDILKVVFVAIVPTVLMLLAVWSASAAGETEGAVEIHFLNVSEADYVRVHGSDDDDDDDEGDDDGAWC